MLIKCLIPTKHKILSLCLILGVTELLLHHLQPLLLLVPLPLKVLDALLKIFQLSLILLSQPLIFVLELCQIPVLVKVIFLKFIDFITVLLPSLLKEL